MRTKERGMKRARRRSWIARIIFQEEETLKFSDEAKGEVNALYLNDPGAPSNSFSEC